MSENASHTGASAAPLTTVDEILALYDFVREYDIHYSTVRSAISTFLVTAVFGLDAWIVAHTADLNLDQVRPRVMYSALLGPLVLLVFALLMSAHFQRLTMCCQKIQEHLEAQLQALHEGRDEFLKSSQSILFRRAIDRLIETDRVTLRPFRADIPQRCLAWFALGQLVASLWYWWPYWW